MELIMKLVTRLVEALELQASNSTKLLAVAEQSLAINQEMLAHVKAQQYATAELIQGVALTTDRAHAPGDGNAPAGQEAAKEHAEATNYDETKHVSQGVLDAAEAASKAEQEARKAADEKAAKDKAELQAAMAMVEERRKKDIQAIKDAQAAQSKQEAPAEQPKAKKITVDDARNALKAYAKVHGNEAAMAILQKHDAVSVSALDPSKYDDFMKDVVA